VGTRQAPNLVSTVHQAPCAFMIPPFSQLSSDTSARIEPHNPLHLTFAHSVGSLRSFKCNPTSARQRPKGEQGRSGGECEELSSAQHEHSSHVLTIKS